MSTAFNRNVRALRESIGLKQEELASKLDITRATVNRWENTDVAKPRQSDVTNKLMDFFNVTESDLFGYADGYYAKSTGLSLPNGALMPTASTAFAPLLGRVHAGTVQDPDLLDEQIAVPAPVLERNPDMYVLEVEGECMNKVYPEGCHIGINPSETPANGSIAVVMIDDKETVIRRYYKGADTLILSPESYNEEFKDIIIRDGDGHTVKICGKVVWFQAAQEFE